MTDGILQEGNYGGDDVEQRAWPELKPLFPHYETLWQNLIFPLTERPNGISLRSDLPKEWMRFAQNHYSIFLHLAAAVGRAKECREKLAFEEVFSHLATMVDLVDDFIFSADEIIKRRSARVPPELDSPDAFAAYLSHWVKSKDGQGYAKMVRQKGRPFPPSIFNEHLKETFEWLTPNHKSLRTQYRDMRRDVRKPRNVFIHTALTAKLLSHGDNRTLAPIDPERYSDWHSGFERANQPDVIARDFREIGELANTTIKAVAETIDTVWEAIWQDSGTQLVQKLPARSDGDGALKSLGSQDGLFTGAPSTSGVAVTISSQHPLNIIWNDGDK